MVVDFLKEISESISISFEGEEARDFAEGIRGELGWLLDIELGIPDAVPAGAGGEGGKVFVTMVMTPTLEKLWRAVVFSIIRTVNRSQRLPALGWLIVKDRHGCVMGTYRFRGIEDLNLLCERIAAQLWACKRNEAMS